MVRFKNLEKLKARFRGWQESRERKHLEETLARKAYESKYKEVKQKSYEQELMKQAAANARMDARGEVQRRTAPRARFAGAGQVLRSMQTTRNKLARDPAVRSNPIIRSFFNVRPLPRKRPRASGGGKKYVVVGGKAYPLASQSRKAKPKPRARRPYNPLDITTW